MKAQRLLAITMLLLGRDSVSAPELAKRFEVSVRTIYRDIEALCEAGIPIVAHPGAGGGYGIVDDYKIDRSLLRPAEIGSLSATLGSLSQAVGDARMSQIADRLDALRVRSRKPPVKAGAKPAARGRAARGLGAAGEPAASALSAENYLFIELTPAARERDKIGILRRAIEESRLVSFSYVDGAGKTSSREGEPYALVFTWQAWYLYAHCRKRDDFRLFKIARMKAIKSLPERFSPRAVDLDSRPWNEGWEETSPFFETRIRFADAARVEEHFSGGDIELEAGGSALVRIRLPADEWAVNFLFGLGLPFEVLEPEALRRLVAERARVILDRND